MLGRQDNVFYIGLISLKSSSEGRITTSSIFLFVKKENERKLTSQSEIVDGVLDKEKFNWNYERTFQSSRRSRAFKYFRLCF